MHDVLFVVARVFFNFRHKYTNYFYIVKNQIFMNYLLFYDISLFCRTL